MTLHGQRYKDKHNEALAKFIVEELPFLDLRPTLEFYRAFCQIDRPPAERTVRLVDKALLACNDRFFLLVVLCGRVDLIHHWLFDRCREVETEPYGYIDLWARYHGKSSIITFAGIIQEIVRDPEVTIAIFSVTKPLAIEFLAQIKNEFEVNELLKEVFPDVLYKNPRSKGDDGRPSKWGVQRGITVKRKGRPKEATVEAHGLIDAQPTSRHFRKHYYDDIVTQDYLSEDLLKKTMQRFELADNLGTRQGTDKAIAGTRYHFADCYGTIIARRSAKPRIYAATIDGTMNGELVLLKPSEWERIKRDQGTKTVSAQMLLNPVAGNEKTFRSTMLRPYEIIPRILNVYILVDPSKGATQRSDRTAIAVIGIDPANNKYLLDGFCHRMRLTERFDRVKQLKAYWERYNGVQIVKVGWEQYGMQTDLEVIEDLMTTKDDRFPIAELNTPQRGQHAKPDRIERLEPDLRGGRFYVPCVAYNFESADKKGPFAGQCYWSVWTEADAAKAKEDGRVVPYYVEQIIWRPVRGLTKLQQEYAASHRSRIVQPLRRLNENKEPYDLTRVFMEELMLHPFAPHDDFMDAASRIYDIEPLPPQVFETKSTESLDVDDRGIDQAAPDTEQDL